MREQLCERNGQRLRFRAKIERFGEKEGWTGFPEETTLLVDVRFVDTDELATDHLWLKSGVWSEGLAQGDEIEFDARVDSYEKGYRGGRAERLGVASYDHDYHLERPTKVVVVKESELDDPDHSCPIIRVRPPKPKPGSMVALGGNTYPHRGTIRDAGGKWDGRLRVWNVPKDEYDRLKALVSGVVRPALGAERAV